MKDRTVMSFFREVIVVHCLILFLFDEKIIRKTKFLKLKKNNNNKQIENVICYFSIQRLTNCYMISINYEGQSCNAK